MHGMKCWPPENFLEVIRNGSYSPVSRPLWILITAFKIACFEASFGFSHRFLPSARFCNKAIVCRYEVSYCVN